jgi:CheY-like chemotaxis protein
MGLPSDDDPPKLTDLDRTTRILAQLESELSRSKRQLAVMWCGLEEAQRRRASSQNVPIIPEDVERRRVTPDALPAVRIAPPRPPPEAVTVAAEVLLIDDDRDLALALAELLVEHGFSVATVHSGEEALTYLLRSARPSVIVLDLMMPGMPGVVVLEHLQQLPAAPEVIVFTAANHDHVARSGIDPATVVRKPWVPMLLDRLWLNVRGRPPSGA